MVITILQIIVAVAMIVLILLQERSAGLSGIFGGDGGSFYQARRGLEKIIYRSTIALAIAFAGLSIARLTLFS